MFYYLNKSQIVQFVLVVLLLAWSVFTIITQVTVCPSDGQSLLFQRLSDYWMQHPANLKMSAILLLLIESLLIGRFYSVNRFSENQTYIPVVFFLLVMNLGGFLATVTPAALTLVFLTLIMRVNTQDENERPVKNRVFTSGLLVGAASLFDPLAVFAVIFLLLSLVTHRYSKPKDVLILLFGLLFVYAYVFSAAFFSDSVPVLTASIKNLSFFGMFKNVRLLSVYDYVFLGYSALLVVYLIIQLKLFYDNKLIVLRKRLVTIYILTFVLIAMMLFSGLELSYGILYIMLPISLYFSMITQYKKRIILHDILIVAFYVLLWL